MADLNDYEKILDKQDVTTEESAITLVEDEQTVQRFNEAKGNEAKRRIVKDEFNKGQFCDPTHIDFFLEQYAKGEILLSSEEEKAKLTQLLQGIDGYKGLTEKANDAAAQEIKAHLTYTTSPVGGMEAMTADVPTTSHTADFGLDQALKEYDRNREKNSFNDLLDEAQKAAVIWQKTGQTAQRCYKKETKSNGINLNANVSLTRPLL